MIIGMKRSAPTAFRDGDEMIAAQAIVAPVKRVIESPGNTRAGYRLKQRKATSAPSKGNKRNRPSWAPVRKERTMSVAVMMTPRPAPSPLKPSSMFAALLALVTPSGTTTAMSTPMSNPRSTVFLAE